jgi:RNA polymerase sigma factor (sigma-70 family)
MNRYSTITDSELLGFCLNPVTPTGELAEAFDELVLRYHPVVYAIGLARLGDGDSAEDLTQEVFLRVFLHLDQLREPALFRPWLVRLARNLSTDWIRSRIRFREVLQSAGLDTANPYSSGAILADPRETLFSAEDQTIIRTAMSSLSVEEREVVLLHYLEDLTHDEIAQGLGVHRSTVSRLLSRGLTRMRKVLGADQGTDSAAPVRRKIATPASAKSATRLLILTVLGLGAAQRNTLAAGLTLPTISATPGLTPQIGFLIMSSSKVTMTALAAVGVGVLFYLSSGTSQRTASPTTTSAGVSGVASVPIPPVDTAALDRVWPNWIAMAQDHAANRPGSTGLDAFTKALSAAPRTIPGALRTLSGRVSGQGWAAATPELDRFLTSHASLVPLAYAASRTAPFSVPATDYPSLPQPDMGWIQNLHHILLLAANKSRSTGHQGESVRLASASALLLQSLCSNRAPLQTHMVVAGATGQSLRLLQRLLSEPGLLPQDLKVVLGDLEKLDQNWGGIGKAIEGEGHSFLGSVRWLKAGKPIPVGNTVLPQLRTIASSQEKLERLETDSWKFFADHAHQLSLPYPTRPRTLAQPPSQLQGLAIANWLELATRLDIARARLRLTRAAIQSRLGSELANPMEIVDPFTSAPLRSTPGQFWSLGPDGVDQQGKLQYDPTNGTMSAGDIVLFVP